MRAKKASEGVYTLQDDYVYGIHLRKPVTKNFTVQDPGLRSGHQTGLKSVTSSKLTITQH